MAESASTPHEDSLAEQLRDAVVRHDLTIATAESLTGGQLAATLSAAPQAGVWFRGGIVAYHPEVKFTLLDTPRGHVVTEDTAAQMAKSVVKLLGADLAVALTGVGGPDDEEGKAPGTVYLATCMLGEEPETRLHVFDGDPLDVMQQTIDAALTALIRRLQALT